MTQTVEPHSLRAWILAARPRTLSGAAMPVAVALVMAYASGSPMQWTPAVLCMLFALTMQIDSNLVNDYYDCLRGVDTAERLGPARACAQGWISLPAMRCGIAVCTVVGCLAGLPLILWGGWQMVGIGAVCVLGCFLYSTLLGPRGLGDVLVVVFFGLVPVCATFFLQTKSIGLPIITMALACGLVTDCLLVVNNYRDRHTDVSTGKHTLVTLIGPRATEWLYLLLGIVGVALSLVLLALYGLPMLLWLVAHCRAWLQMRRIGSGRALNGVFALTARHIALFGLCFCTCQIFKTIITQ